MTKRVEFHQVTVTVVAKIVDDERSYGTVQPFQFNLLMDTDAEWADARKRVAEHLKKLQEQLDGNGD